MNTATVTIKGKLVYVGAILAGEITGKRYWHRGEPCGSYDFIPADGWTSPWKRVVRDIKGHGGWCYFDEAVRDIRYAVLDRELTFLA